jgi:hypothetical protein
VVVVVVHRRRGKASKQACGRIRVFEARGRHGRRLFVGVKKRRVAWLAITDPHRMTTGVATRKALHG